MTDPQEFLAEVERFLSDTGMAPAKFGVDACNDSALVFDLRAGREPRSRTIRRVREFMALCRIPVADAAPDSVPAAPDATPSSEATPAAA